MDVSGFREVIDPLYGHVTMDEFLAELAAQPELQRLRDVRLSNINSLLLAGGANISRYEHSLGVAILASRAAAILELSVPDRRLLVCAALLHDVAITPFGHLMEEAFRCAGLPFDHERRMQQIFLGEAEIGNVDRQVYRGRAAGFRAILRKQAFRKLGITPSDVFALIQGEGALGLLINGSLDLDNADNLARMAYHIGLPFRRSLPTEIAESFRFTGGALAFDGHRTSLIDEWLDLRFRLYSVFMTNPLDFAAKAMLIEAMRLALIGVNHMSPLLTQESWSLTDRELLTALSAFGPTAHLIERLELADLFDVLGLYWIRASSSDSTAIRRDRADEIRQRLAGCLQLDSEDVLVYWIPDKRSRNVSGLRLVPDSFAAADGPLLGVDSDLMLFGAFVGKKGAVTRKRAEDFRLFLSDQLGCVSVSRCEPRHHLTEAFRWTDKMEATKSDTMQLTLF